MLRGTNVVRLPDARQKAARRVRSTERSQSTGPSQPSTVQLAWLRRGLDQAGGKLPLFDINGKRYDERTIRRCIERGWAEPWFNNPTKPDWLVCRLTDQGRGLFG